MIRNRFSEAIVLVLVGFVALGLFARADVGLADNGDFTRAMTVFTSRPFGFEINWPDPADQRVLWERRFFKYYIPYWILDFPEPFSLNRPFKSSAYILWYPGIFINQIFWHGDILNLAVMSLPQRIGLIVWYWLFLKYFAQRTVKYKPIILFGLGIPIGLVLLSPYTYYLNSFYYESAGLYFLLLFLFGALLLNSKPYSFVKVTLIAVLLACLIGTAKAQWFYWPIVSGMAVLRIIWKWNRQLSLKHSLLLVMVILAASYLCLAITRPADIALSNNAYHRFFTGTLALSRMPEQHLVDLGAPNAVDCVGVVVYTEKGQKCKAQVERILNWLNYLRILQKEPILLFKMLEDAANHMHTVQITYLGVFTSNDPRAHYPVTINLVDTWTKVKLLYPRGWILFVWLFICAGICWVTAGRDDELSDLGIMGIIVYIGTLLDMMVVYLGEGLYEIEKHLFLANVTFDLGVVVVLNIGLLCLVHWGARLIRLIRPLVGKDK